MLASLIASSARLLPTTFSSAHPPFAREPLSPMTKWRQQYIGSLSPTQPHLHRPLNRPPPATRTCDVNAGWPIVGVMGKAAGEKYGFPFRQESRRPLSTRAGKLTWITDNVEVLAADWLYRRIENTRGAKSDVWHTPHTRWKQRLACNE